MVRQWQRQRMPNGFSGNRILHRNQNSYIQISKKKSFRSGTVFNIPYSCHYSMHLCTSFCFIIWPAVYRLLKKMNIKRAAPYLLFHIFHTLNQYFVTDHELYHVWQRTYSSSWHFYILSSQLLLAIS